MSAFALSRTALVGAWAVFLTLGAVGAGPAVLAPDRSREQSGTPVAVRAHQEKVPSPPEGAKAPAGTAGKSPAGAGRQGAVLKVDAVFHDSNRLLQWMLQNGWVVLLADKDNRLTARVTAEGRLIGPTIVTAGTPRDATSEIAGFIGGLPSGAARGLLIWPDRVWAAIERKIRAREESPHTARLRYDLSPAGALAVTVVEIHSARGVTRPGETFVIQL